MPDTIAKIYCAPYEDKDEINYFYNFILKYKKEAKILIKGGVLGKGNEGWHNVAKHCIAVAIGANILAELLGADRDKIVKGCLLHDWYKRNEVKIMNKLGGQKGYEQSNKEDKKLLQKYGVPRDIIKIAHANVVETADLKHLKKRSIEEKMMHYIDMITSEVEFVGYKKRLIKVLQKKRNVEFSESFRARPKYKGRALFELNYDVIRDEQRELEQKLGIKTGTMISFLKKKFKERINSDKK